MAQFIGVILVLVLVKLLIEQIKPLWPKSPAPQKGDFIDISEKWISADKMPYQSTGRLLTEQQLALFRLFQEIVTPGPYTVYPHIRLADLVKVPPGTVNRQEYQFRIEERSVDLVVMEGSNLQPLLGINFVSSRDSQRQQISDQFISQVLRSAGLGYLTVDLDDPPEREQLRRDLNHCGVSV